MFRLFFSASVFLVGFTAVIFLQRSYDRQWFELRKTIPEALAAPSLLFVKSFDLGLHSAAASLRWLDTRLQLPFVPKGLDKFLQDLQLINDLDPKFSTPYAITVLVLPDERYPEWTRAAVEVGKRGVRDSAPDWRIPFYLAADYYLYLQDDVNAAKYFDIAANTPGIPETVRTYAMNYGIYPGRREQIKQIWIAIYESTEDEWVRERAATYIEHYEILDVLYRAVSLYYQKYGKYPQKIIELADANILRDIPKSPLGFEFEMWQEGKGGIIGIRQ